MSDDFFEPWDVSDKETFYNHDRKAASGDASALSMIALHRPASELHRWLHKLTSAFDAAGSEDLRNLIGHAIGPLADLQQAVEVAGLSLSQLDQKESA